MLALDQPIGEPDAERAGDVVVTSAGVAHLVVEMRFRLEPRRTFERDVHDAFQHLPDMGAGQPIVAVTALLHRHQKPRRACRDGRWWFAASHRRQTPARSRSARGRRAARTGYWRGPDRRPKPPLPPFAVHSTCIEYGRRGAPLPPAMLRSRPKQIGCKTPHTDVAAVTRLEQRGLTVGRFWLLCLFLFFLFVGGWAHGRLYGTSWNRRDQRRGIVDDAVYRVRDLIDFEQPLVGRRDQCSGDVGFDIGA